MMTQEARHLHLLGATGTARTEMWNGKEYLVVPVVSLLEGVIHAVNAETPEFVPFSTLEKAAKSWNGKPVTLGHPKKNGKQCSAADDGIAEAHGIGVIRNSRADKATKKMLQEAWIEKAKAKRLDAQMLARLEANKTEEVSVGAFVVTDGVAGDYNGRSHKGSWVEASGDHLAFLPGGRGACSVEMGCGTHRAAMHFVTAEGFVLEDDIPSTVVFSAFEGMSLDKRLQAVNDAVYKKYSSTQNQTIAGPSAYPYEVFDKHVVVRYETKLLDIPYEMKDGEVVLGEPTEVKLKQTYIAAAKYADCETCDGTGQVKDGDAQKDCPTCGGEGKLRAAAGARHSTSDLKMIQTVHDHATALGAKCDRGNYETAQAAPPSNVSLEGGMWVVRSKSGLRLGAHTKKEDAVEHEQAIARSLARQGVA